MVNTMANEMIKRKGGSKKKQRKEDCNIFCDYRKIISNSQAKKGFYFCNKRNETVFRSDCEKCRADGEASFKTVNKIFSSVRNG